MRNINVGIVGLGGRGAGLLKTILSCEAVTVTALCDLYSDRVSNAKKTVMETAGNTPKTYLDYTELVADPDVEAVVVATSWEAHVDVAVASMRAHKYTALEVGGAYDVEDCWHLVRTYEETKTPIMLLENCCFNKFELTATALARAGKFGRIMYCHGAYGHELRGEILGGEINRHYRLRNYRARNCENYPTHELGPIAKLLNINRGNKMLSLTSVATKSGVGIEACANSDATPDENMRGVEFNQGDIVITTITCQNGEVITLKLDTSLPRFYSREFTVRGTKGLCTQDSQMALFESTTKLHDIWEPAEVIRQNIGNIYNYTDYIPDMWRNVTDKQLELGHGGMDYFEFVEFFNAIREGREMPIDVYDAAAWMVITPLSEQSIAHGGMPQPIPDFTRGKYLLREPRDVIELPKPECDECEGAGELGFSRP